MRTARIAVLPGDGVGPEVIAEGVRVLRAVEERWGHRFELSEALVGGAAIDATGQPLPDETLALARAADAVLLGAVGGPKWDDPSAAVRPEQGLLALRRGLGVFANLRPVTVSERLAAIAPLRPERLAGVDLLVVRELTGGIYFGEKRRDTLPDGGERAFDACVYTTEEIERVVRVAAMLARHRRKRLTSVDKANVLETSRLWRRVATRVMRDEFPDVQLEHLLVDACAMHLLRRPADFDVIVTENMFGDILTDEASMLAGSMGMLPSASLGESRAMSGSAATPSSGSATAASATNVSRAANVSDAAANPTRPGLYEPIHGSAPDIAGRGVANPLATILSVAMLLRYSLGLHEEARAVEAAVQRVLDEGCVTADIAEPGAPARSTSDVGRAVAERVRATDGRR